MSAFFSGSVDPFWPHFILISLTVLGGIAVGFGIIKESEKWSTATILVVIGVATEAIFTIILFRFDEGISQSQQSRIIALDNDLLNEQRLTAKDRMTIERLVSAIAPRNVEKDRLSLISALKAEDLGPISIAYINKEEPMFLAIQMSDIFVCRDYGKTNHIAS